MMSKTHLTMGVAISVALTQPKTVPECFLSIIGGAVGGILCDIDTLDNDYKCDALSGQLIALGITAALFALDYFLNTGICTYLLSRNRVLLIIGGIMYLIPWVIGFISEHRTFTHSLTAMLLFTIAVLLICPTLVVSFVIGYLTHLALDLLNKKDLRLLYPLKFGLCFHLCYASKTANTVFMYVGSVGSIFFILNSMLLHLF